MLDGDIVEKDSNITFGSIQVKGHALLCVIPNKGCCEDTEGTITAEFLYPNGTHVSLDAHGVYITRGKQIIRLNHVPGLANLSPPTGLYCCSVSTSDGTKKSCVNLQSEHFASTPSSA